MLLKRFICAALLSCVFNIAGFVNAADLISWSAPEFISRDSAEVGVADIDKDGNVDIVVAGGQQRWYAGPDFDTFYTLGVSDGGPYAGRVADINDDGWPDFVTSDGERTGSSEGELYVYLNPGNAGDPKDSDDWTRVTVHSSTDSYHQNDLRVVDMDGDDKLDIIVRTWGSERVIVAMQDASASDWTVRVFDTGETGKPEGISAGDITGDDKMEIVLSGVYWSNANWRTGQPIEHLVDTNFQGSTFGKVKSAVGDIDKDGDNDVYMGSAEGSDRYLAWYENQGLNATGSTIFVRHIIKDDFGKCHMVQLVDIDQDGDLDLATGRSFGQEGILVFYNEYTPADGVSWTEQNHDTDGEIYTGIVADLDKDQDLDVVGPSKFYGGNIRIYRNLTPVDPISLSLESLEFTSAAANQAVALSSDPAWTSQSDSAWLTVNPSSGSGDASLMVMVTANTSFAPRSGLLTFNNGSATQTLAVTQAGIPDAIPPGAPSNLSADGVGYDRVNLSWAAASDNSGLIAEYIVYAGNTEVARAPSTSVIVGGLLSETNYTFQVSAVDNAGNKGARSLAVMIETGVRPPSEPPLYYWRLDESSGAVTANEAINNQNYALAGMTGAEWQTGVLGNALAFNQSDNDDRIELGALDAASDEITLSAWIRPTNFADYPEGRIIAKASGISEGDHYWMLSTIKSGSAHVPRVRLRTGGQVTTLVGSTAADVAEDVWSHIAATYDGATLKLWLNGTEVASVAKTGAVDQNDSVNATIGNIPSGNRDGRAFAGAIDEVCLFDFALSTEDIAGLHNSGNGAPCDDYGQGNQDITPPLLVEVITVSSPTENLNPTVVINSSEAATASFLGDCAAMEDVPLIEGENTLTLGPFVAPSLVDDCRILAVDESENTSLELLLSAFSIQEPDTSPPTVTINQADEQADPTSSNLVIFEISFNEPINDQTLTAADIVLMGTAGQVSSGPTAVNSQLYRFSVTGMMDGDVVSAIMPADRVEDLAGNLNLGSVSTDNTVTYQCDGCVLDDEDQDGIDASVDNCPDEANPDQRDTDGNGVGDVCDADDELCLPIKTGTAEFSVICL